MDLLNPQNRLRIIQEINDDENKQRKLLSFKQSNMQNDNFWQYVYEWLENKYQQSVKDMSVIANVNLQRRVSKQEASIYKRKPTRTFSMLTEEQHSVIDAIYKDGKFDTKLKKSNENFKYQQQSCLQLVPVQGKLELRVLKPHQYDVVPDPKNPEEAFAYIMSNFDYTNYDKVRRAEKTTGFSQGRTYRDGMNQKIGDVDDAQVDQYFYVWTKELHFVMNQDGNIVDKQTLQPLSEIEEADLVSPLAEYGIMPFIDIADEKEFEYWVRPGNSLFDATVVYNGILSNEHKVVEMQGHAQCVVTAPAGGDFVPDNIQVGPTSIVYLPVDPNNPVTTDLKFVSPNADLASIRDFRESYLNAFLSSRGLETSTVSGSPVATDATSGVDRLLKMIEKFEASENDLSLYEQVETKLYNITIAWIKALNGARDLNGNPVLNEKYQAALPELDKTEAMVMFSKPQAVKSDEEVMNMIERKIALGLMSRTDALAELEGIDKEEAESRKQEIDNEDRNDFNGVQVSLPQE